jgi:hypothetical protein
MNKAAKWFSPRNWRTRQLSAGLCLLLFVVLQTFASSGSLHKLVHHDADSPGHQCAITLLAQGQIDSPVVPTGPVPLTAEFIFSPLPSDSPVVSTFDYRLSPSRAPPLV